MKIFLDTADVGEIRKGQELGLIDGVTTNPSLIVKSGRSMREVIAEICAVVDGPVSAEVTALDCPTMLQEGRYLADIAPNVAIKVPLTPDGLKACRILRYEGKLVNVTLCFSVAQALLAAKAGASFISPFVGRLDDLGQDGMLLIREIAALYQRQSFATKILVASVRGSHHVVQAGIAGADIATLPPSILYNMFEHPLTQKGIDIFLSDWSSKGCSILPDATVNKG